MVPELRAIFFAPKSAAGKSFPDATGHRSAGDRFTFLPAANSSPAESRTQPDPLPQAGIQKTRSSQNSPDRSGGNQ